MILAGWLLVLCVVLVIIRGECCERNQIKRYDKALERHLRKRNQM